MERFEIGDTVKVYGTIISYKDGNFLRGNIKTFIFGKRSDEYSHSTYFTISKTGKDRGVISDFDMQTTRMVITEKVWKILK